MADPDKFDAAPGSQEAAEPNAWREAPSPPSRDRPALRLLTPVPPAETNATATAQTEAQRDAQERATVDPTPSGPSQPPSDEAFHDAQEISSGEAPGEVSDGYADLYGDLYSEPFASSRTDQGAPPEPWPPQAGTADAEGWSGQPAADLSVSYPTEANAGAPGHPDERDVSVPTDHTDYDLEHFHDELAAKLESANRDRVLPYTPEPTYEHWPTDSDLFHDPAVDGWRRSVLIRRLVTVATVVALVGVAAVMFRVAVALNESPATRAADNASSAGAPGAGDEQPETLAGSVQPSVDRVETDAPTVVARERPAANISVPRRDERPAYAGTEIRRIDAPRAPQDEPSATGAGPTAGTDAPSPTPFDAATVASEQRSPPTDAAGTGEEAQAEPATDNTSGPVEATRSAQVTTDVNMRAGPDNNAEAITVVPAGSRVDVVGCEYWCEVTYDGQRGWIYKSYIEDTGA